MSSGAPALPSRPLPTVRVVDSSPDDAVPVAVDRRPGAGTRGAADEVRVDRAEGDTGRDASGLRLVVTLDPDAPRAGWAGAVDAGLGARRAGAALARERVARGASAPVAIRAEDWTEHGGLGDVVLGYLLGALGQDARRAAPAPTAPDLVVVGGGDEAEIVDRSVARARATAFARDLAGSAPNLATPEVLTGWMAERLRAAGMDCEVLDETRLAELGFGGVLAVGGGSAHPPRVLVARRPGPGRRVLLVGKGITFDTGGISIKPGADMHLMRTDMAGSAAVVAAAAAYAEAHEGSDLDLTVVVPSAENAVSGSAYRPGDVVTHLGGTTSEVSNTDAEGRMVLADGLVHGIGVADPEVVVDVATLTGAMKIALGMRTGAVMTNDPELADRLSAAGAEAGERWWRLPLPEDLRDSVRSSIADRKQAPGGPGAITAALFLEGFVDGRRWAHLDIAGPARSPEELDEVTPVATGFATRSLIGLLEDLAADEQG